ncbi:hypothetical protein GJAV_G00034090, partial [Gymnothorax javanicus]
ESRAPDCKSICKIKLSPQRKNTIPCLFFTCDSKNRIMVTESYDYPTEDDLDVTYKYEENFTSRDPVPLKDKIFLVLNATIFLLGIFGNGVVIWISGFKMKKSVNSTWYLSLAVSDFMFCCCLPFTIVQLAASDWLFGLTMCKFNSFVMFLNMFSSIFLLVIISVDRCVTVVFPVWSQNNRSVRVASVVVIIAWAISSVLSVPSLIYREIRKDKKTVCYNNYEGKEHAHLVIAMSRFYLWICHSFSYHHCLLHHHYSQTEKKSHDKILQTFQSNVCHHSNFLHLLAALSHLYSA